MADRRSHRRDRRLPDFVTFVGLSLVAHLFLFGLLTPLWPHLKSTPDRNARPVQLIIEVPEEPELAEPEIPDPELDGQIVDLPEPTEKERPKDADYLAEHDRVVEEETRAQRYRVNPEVLAPTFSEDDKLQFEDLMDVNADEPSTGAQVGNDRFDPDRDGRLASLPSPFTLTNKEGLQRPVPASTSSQDVAGAPNNDLLDEKVGRALALNTREMLGASYINSIRRLVNFYWKQNLDNLPPRLPLSRPRYTTRVNVVLDSYGSLQAIQITEGSGADPLDNAVVDAFRVAGPFPNPPEQLISQDGQVYLPDMGWTVELGQARAVYRGVDPRQGVQFPGILKANR